MSCYIIGIAGGSGSGKSTFAENIKAKFEDKVTLIKCDNYYIPHDDISMEERQYLNYDAPESIDFALLAEHLQMLRQGQEVVGPLYDFSIHTRSHETVLIKPTPIIILDGILIFANPQLRELFNLKIYAETDADERILRRLRRDIMERGRTIDSVIDQYITTVKPMHNIYVEPTKSMADIVVNGGRNESAISVVCARIESFLATHQE